MSCQLDILKTALPQAVRLILDGLPKTLDESYESMLMKINMTLRKPAIRLFRCLVAAVRPLRVEELAEILSMDFDDEEADPRHDMDQNWEDQERAVLFACTSLVDVFDMGGSKAVRFSHPSVKEFLTSKHLATSSDRVSSYYIQQDSAHKMLARACLSALLRLNATHGSPFANYAARYWVDHVHSGDVALLDEMIQLFDAKKPHFSAWIAAYDVDVSSMTGSARPGPGTPLYYATLCNLYDLAKHLLKERLEDIDVEGGQYTTAIHAASYKGHLSIAELLISKGANVNCRDQESKEKSTPLHIATRRGDTKMMECLISNGADVNATESDGSCPLYIALNDGNRDDNFKVIELLIQHSADVNIPNNQGQSPLHLAALRGNLKIVSLLVEKGARVNAQNKDESTPIHLASNRRVVELLIKHDAYVTAQDNNGSTPLHLASDDGNFELVKLLIERGANVNARDKNNSTPLHVVSRRGPVEAVQLLLNSGAETNAQNDQGWTALHIASQEGAVGVVKCLLATGKADTNIEDADHRTPRHLASQKKNSTIVQLLNEASANPVARDSRNQTPYQLPSVTSPRLLSPSPSGEPS